MPPGRGKYLQSRADQKMAPILRQANGSDAVRLLYFAVSERR